MKLKLLPLIALAAAACGGTANDTASTAEFQGAAPSYDTVALQQNDGDATPPAGGAYDNNAPGVQADGTAVTTANTGCQPHLMDHAHDVMARMNRHFLKQLHHVQELISDAPKLAAGQTHTWENVKNGIDRKFTITKTVNADASVTYAFELDVSAVGGTAVKVMDGSITRIGGSAQADAGAAANVETKGTINFNYDALASVDTTEKAKGQVAESFDHLKDAVNGEKRTAQLVLTNFVPDTGDARGPRSGTFNWLREPNKGGLFTFTDSFPTSCTTVAPNTVSDMSAAARWYKSTDGGIHGRTDAKLTGGQIPSGDAYLAVACAQGATTSTPAEGFWAVKLENTTTGATVNGTLDQSGATPCDAALGTDPSSAWLQGNTVDFNFNSTVSFPGEF